MNLPVPNQPRKNSQREPEIPEGRHWKHFQYPLSLHQLMEADKQASLIERFESSPVLDEYWYRWYVNTKHSLCALCANSGVIETNPTSGEGVTLKTRTWCMCTNGQLMRRMFSERDGDMFSTPESTRRRSQTIGQHHSQRSQKAQLTDHGASDANKGQGHLDASHSLDRLKGPDWPV